MNTNYNEVLFGNKNTFKHIPRKFLTRFSNSQLDEFGEDLIFYTLYWSEAGRLQGELAENCNMTIEVLINFLYNNPWDVQNFIINDLGKYDSDGLLHTLIYLFMNTDNEGLQLSIMTLFKSMIQPPFPTALSRFVSRHIFEIVWCYHLVGYLKYVKNSLLIEHREPRPYQ